MEINIISNGYLLLMLTLHKLPRNACKRSVILVEDDAAMYPRVVTLLILSYSLNKLVKHKLPPVNILSETIFMDGMP